MAEGFGGGIVRWALAMRSDSRMRDRGVNAGGPGRGGSRTAPTVCGRFGVADARDGFGREIGIEDAS